MNSVKKLVKWISHKLNGDKIRHLTIAISLLARILNESFIDRVKKRFNSEKDFHDLILRIDYLLNTHRSELLSVT